GIMFGILTNGKHLKRPIYVQEEINPVSIAQTCRQGLTAKTLDDLQVSNLRGPAALRPARVSGTQPATVADC
ncbi:MAG: hypothetical protein AAFQ05_10900, partial [Pseudomonadota bacterium]